MIGGDIAQRSGPGILHCSRGHTENLVCKEKLPASLGPDTASHDQAPGVQGSKACVRAPVLTRRHRPSWWYPALSVATYVCHVLSAIEDTSQLFSSSITRTPKGHFRSTGHVWALDGGRPIRRRTLLPTEHELFFWCFRMTNRLLKHPSPRPSSLIFQGLRS